MLTQDTIADLGDFSPVDINFGDQDGQDVLAVLHEVLGNQDEGDEEESDFEAEEEGSEMDSSVDGDGFKVDRVSDDEYTEVVRPVEIIRSNKPPPRVDSITQENIVSGKRRR